jgi:hypothetical protein
MMERTGRRKQPSEWFDVVGLTLLGELSKHDPQWRDPQNRCSGPKKRGAPPPMGANRYVRGGVARLAARRYLSQQLQTKVGRVALCSHCNEYSVRCGLILNFLPPVPRSGAPHLAPRRNSNRGK